MENFEQEQVYFDEQTAKMNIFVRAKSEAYARYREFGFGALALLPEVNETPFVKWLPFARLAARRQTEDDQLAIARKSIDAYRKQIGLNNFSEPRINKQDALSVLFMFALEDWPNEPDTQAVTNVVQAIDEFSSLYIEFFGGGAGLVQTLKKCFDL